MSRVVDLNLTDVPRAGRPAKYPWDDWFDGRTHVLVQGEDYESDPKAFRSTVYSAADRLNVTVVTKIIDGELHIQAVSKSVNGKKPRRKRSED